MPKYRFKGKQVRVEEFVVIVDREDLQSAQSALISSEENTLTPGVTWKPDPAVPPQITRHVDHNSGEAIQPSLDDMMDEVEEYIDQLANETQDPDHHDVCSKVADRFTLWDEHHRFPTWLSRVVDGRLRDLAEKGDDADHDPERFDAMA